VLDGQVVIGNPRATGPGLQPKSDAWDEAGMKNIYGVTPTIHLG